MTSLNAVGPNFKAFSGGVQSADNSPRFGSIASNLAGDVFTPRNRVIPLVGPFFAALAGLAVLPLMLLKLKGCCLLGCLSTAALGAFGLLKLVR